MSRKNWMTLGFAAILASTTPGCDTPGKRQTHRANSLFKYLYSGEVGHIDTPAMPILSLPLRVGIAFVPADVKPGQTHWEDPVFSENQKMALMKEISEQFKSYPFVKAIELIPTGYLSPQGGFANLDQLRSIYGVDVIALLSYDQVQFTDEGFFSLGYWTIVGLYVVEGEKNDTQTMLDGAVYDIASRKLLLRAPGLSTVKGRATLINLSEELRNDSEIGFKKASTNLVANLKVQLDEFRQKVTNSPTEYKIVRKPGYTAAAGFRGIEVLLLATLSSLFLWMRRDHKF